MFAGLVLGLNHPSVRSRCIGFVELATAMGDASISIISGLLAIIPGFLKENWGLEEKNNGNEKRHTLAGADFSFPGAFFCLIFLE